MICPFHGDSQISVGKSFFLGPVQLVQRTFHSQAWVPMFWIGMEREGALVPQFTQLFSASAHLHHHPELYQYSQASGCGRVSPVKFHWALHLQKVRADSLLLWGRIRVFWWFHPFSIHTPNPSSKGCNSST